MYSKKYGRSRSLKLRNFSAPSGSFWWDVRKIAAGAWQQCPFELPGDDISIHKQCRYGAMEIAHLTTTQFFV
jgi:hypothetical protein